MKMFDEGDLKKLYKPPPGSHKGQNGRLLIVGGSHLFHGASLWALKVASRIVDMVFYASVSENIALTEKLKSELYDFIAIDRSKISEYVQEADVILLGPGLPREDGREEREESTKKLVKELITTYKDTKRWVIDAGALTEMDPQLLLQLKDNVILTPHKGEFETLKRKVQSAKFKAATQNLKLKEQVELFAKEYNCIVLLKGQEDVVCSIKECVSIVGGNAGMTKGGTGDVLAGLVAALYCKNDAFLAAAAGSFINKKAGESLYKSVGPYFNASDLCDEIPKVIKELVLK